MTTPDIVGKIGDSDSAEPPRVEAAAPEPRLTRPLPTDRLSFTNQISVIRAYGISGADGSGKVVGGAELARLTGLHPGSVGLNHSFMADVQLITKAGTGYVPNADVIAYARAHGFAPDTAAHRLAPTLRRSWFGELLIPRLLMGRPTTEEQALSDLAVHVGATGDHRQRLLTVLEYLALVGLITREGGMLRAGPTARPDGDLRPADAGPTAPTDMAPASDRIALDRSGGGPPSRVQTSFSSAPMGGINFTVQVNVDLLEMATWRPEATAAFFEGLAKVISAKAMVERDSTRKEVAG